MLRVRIPSNDPRSEARIREHYEVERGLAQRLRDADKAARRTLYTEVYDDLYRLQPDHPQILMAGSSASRGEQVAKLVGWLASHLRPNDTFLEIGPGDCQLSFALAPRCAYVHAVDVTDGIPAGAALPANFALHISDGTGISLPDASIDLAFSDQLMEHLHPDDALDQLREVYRVLEPGGTYVCITPNRLSGPHDVSRFFCDVAEGFHIHEYTSAELAKLMRAIGFRGVRAAIPLRGRLTSLPLAPFLAFEAAIAALPARARRRLSESRYVPAVLGIRLFAYK